MTEPRILLATPHAGYELRLRRAFGDTLNGELRRWDVGTSPLSAASLTERFSFAIPDVVAIGPDVEVEDALALARDLERDRPEVSVLLISAPTSELWERALRSGVRDVLDPEAQDGEVRAAFDRALEVASRRRHNLVGPAGDANAGGSIITVLSPKGGSGKTTVSSNLAVGLALAHPDESVVVDLDLQFGDIATALRLTPEHTLLDAVRGGSADRLTLKTFLSSHPSSLWALCGPESPADGEDIGAAAVTEVVRTLAEEFRYLVVDTGAGLSEHALAVLDISTDLVLICAMDVPSIRSLRKEIDALDQLGMTHQRRHLVINRADSKVGLELREVEAAIGMPVDVALSSSRSVPLSMNQGSPLVESDPRSPVARQLLELVARFGEPATASRGRRTRRSAR